MRTKGLFSSAAALALALGATPGISAPDQESVASARLSTQQDALAARRTIQLRDGWRFRLDDRLGGAERPGFNDSDWEVVNVPHSWNRVGYYLPEPQDHVHRADNVNKTQGIGWYRLSFEPPAEASGRRAFLEFDAASRTAEVWLNGIKLGSHEGGFSRFRFDATAALRPGVANLLVVKTDNTHPAPGTGTENTLPLTGDFFIHGGLYRPARLILTDPVHIDMLDYGGPGVLAHTRSIGPERAEIAVRTKLRNDRLRAARLNLVTRLIDDQGRTAAESRERVRIAAGASTEILQSLNVDRPHLWQGVEDPYLYRLSTELRSSDGRVIDSLEQGFGIREMRLDPERGFLLNGRVVRLHGVGLHQDVEGKGWAVSDEDIAETVAIIREMGANTIRLTHYQHGTPIHELADRHGLILWDEIALVTAWTHSQDQQEAPAGILANARLQLQEMIRQNYNHASVAVWGIANEVDFGPGRPDFLGRGTVPDSVPSPMPLLSELHALAKAEDPNRPTALATCCEERNMRDVPIAAEATDAAGHNRYFGWYYGRPEELGPHLDLLRSTRPQQPLSVSEYGAGGAISLHTDDPLGGPIDMGGPTQPEEYQSWLHEENWRVLKDRPYLWGTWLWNAFDFATVVRREGDSQDINTKGLVTYDRRVKKDAYYFYRANWSSEPTVHVTSRRYVDRAYPVTDVRVYSNAPSTELLVNGRSIGTRNDCPMRVCVWEDVRLSAGANAVAARGQFPNQAIEDRIEWNVGQEVANSFRIDSGAILAANSANGRFGSDAFFEGGRAGTADQIRRGRPPVRAAIVGSADRDLLATFREGRFRYRLPLERGRYSVSLTFIEPTSAPGERQFDVAANGVRKLQSLDVAAAGGTPLTAVRRNFTVDVEDQGLELSFSPVKGQAIVSAIEVTAQ